MKMYSINWVPSQCFQNVREVVQHEDGLQSWIAVRLGLIVQIQAKR